MKTFRVVNVFSFALFWIFIAKVISDPSKCRVKLLNDYQSVPDSAFSATSYFIPYQEKKADFSAKAARENYDKENEVFAWCPSNQVEKSLSEYLQIDLGRLTMIKVVLTKGRFAQGSGKEFTPLYQIRYSRNNGSGSDWKNYRKFKEKGFQKILNGPTDAFIDAFETLDPPIIGRTIRIFPYSNVLQRVCLKLQLFGCIFSNDILEYQIPQGTAAFFKDGMVKIRNSFEGNLEYFLDNGYDGTIVNDHLVGGLGLLTDNEIGLDFTVKETEAYRYIGWTQSPYSLKSKLINIKFIFLNRRNFSSITLYSFSKPLLGINYFSRIDISFSSGQESLKTVEFDNLIRNFNQSDHSIKLDVGGKTGKFVNLTLHFASQWLLLSEIRFISNPLDPVINGNKISLQNNNNNNINNNNDNNDKDHLNTSQFTPVTPSIIYRNFNYDSVTPKTTEKTVSIEIIYLLTILLCLLLGIITAICSFWIIIRKRRTNRRRSIKKQAMALCSQTSFIPYNHNSKSVQCLPSSLATRPIYPSFTVDRRNYPNETLRKMSHPSGSNLPPSTSLDQNGFMSKQYLPETNIYTSIGSSDNDSSLSPEYGTMSMTNDIALQANNFEANSPYLPPPIEPIRPQMFNDSFMDSSDCPSFYYPLPNTIPNIQDPTNINFWRFNGQPLTNKAVNFSSQMSFNDFSKDVMKLDQQTPQDNLMNISSIYSDLPRINSHH